MHNMFEWRFYRNSFFCIESATKTNLQRIRGKSKHHVYALTIDKSLLLESLSWYRPVQRKSQPERSGTYHNKQPSLQQRAKQETARSTKKNPTQVPLFHGTRLCFNNCN